MVAILENPEIRQRVGRLTVEQYTQLTEDIPGPRTELIRGISIEKMAPSPQHSFLVEQLGAAIRSAAGPGACCRQEQPLRLRDSMPEPDFAVVAGRTIDYRATHPSTALLVVEVAITSLGLDHEKAAIYAEAGVPEYWIVVAKEKAVKVFTDPQEGIYGRQRTHAGSETVISTAVPALRGEVAALFPR